METNHLFYIAHILGLPITTIARLEQITTREAKDIIDDFQKWGPPSEFYKEQERWVREMQAKYPPPRERDNGKCVS